MDSLDQILSNLPYLKTGELIKQLDDNYSDELMSEIIHRINYNKYISTLANIEYLRNRQNLNSESIINSGG